MRSVRSCDGTTIAYDTAGQGPAVILVDGELCHRGSGPGAELAGRLAARYTVVTYDRRGRGGSADIAPYAVQREIEDLAALIERAGGSAQVCGLFTGAALALAAAGAGLAITRLALYEPPFVVDDWRPPVPRNYLARLTELVTAGRRGDAVELYLAKSVGLPAELATRLRAALVWPAMEQLAHTLVYDAMIMAGSQAGLPLPATRWACVRVPTLVLHGDRSEGYLRTAARALAGVLPGARWRAVPGQDHQLAPGDIASVLEEFFTEQEGSQP